MHLFRILVGFVRKQLLLINKGFVTKIQVEYPSVFNTRDKKLVLYVTKTFISMGINVWKFQLKLSDADFTIIRPVVGNASRNTFYREEFVNWRWQVTVRLILARMSVKPAKQIMDFRSKMESLGVFLSQNRIAWKLNKKEISLVRFVKKSSL